MKKPDTVCSLLMLAWLALASPWASADSWMPPETKVTESANGQARVTVVPRPLINALAYFEDKVEGTEPAGLPAGEAQASPMARVERREAGGDWRLAWQMPLVNEVGPNSVLLTNDASFLVTFDNWHSAGYGDNVVAIYDRAGSLVRKLSVEEILPAVYVPHLPRTVSSRWWGGQHTLVDDDRMVELQVVQPGQRMNRDLPHVPVRIRLVDGVVMPPTGEAWESAMAKATELETERLADWDALRRLRASPLESPGTRDTKVWRAYMFELRDRIEHEGERIGGMVLAAPGENPGFHKADSISSWIEHFDNEDKYSHLSFIFASPSSDRLAGLLVDSLSARGKDSMTAAHIIFVGTPAEGERVRKAARHTGAKVTFVDRTKAFPPGKPLPEAPPSYWLF